MHDINLFPVSTLFPTRYFLFIYIINSIYVNLNEELLSNNNLRQRTFVLLISSTSSFARTGRLVISNDYYRFIRIAHVPICEYTYTYTVCLEIIAIYFHNGCRNSKHQRLCDVVDINAHVDVIFVTHKDIKLFYPFASRE